MASRFWVAHILKYVNKNYLKWKRILLLSGSVYLSLLLSVVYVYFDTTCMGVYSLCLSVCISNNLYVCIFAVCCLCAFETMCIFSLCLFVLSMCIFSLSVSVCLLQQCCCLHVPSLYSLSPSLCECLFSLKPFLFCYLSRQYICTNFRQLFLLLEWVMLSFSQVSLHKHQAFFWR